MSNYCKERYVINKDEMQYYRDNNKDKMTEYKDTHKDKHI